MRACVCVCALEVCAFVWVAGECVLVWMKCWRLYNMLVWHACVCASAYVCVCVSFVYCISLVVFASSFVYINTAEFYFVSSTDNSVHNATLDLALDFIVHVISGACNHLTRMGVLLLVG